MSVKVAVRCRPLSLDEQAEKTTVIVRMNDGEVTVLDSLEGLGGKFAFDEALWSTQVVSEGCTNPHASQSTVYRCVASELMNHVVTGYNGCIFAYGQTGSGKTYSMMGIPTDLGVIPRVAASLFTEVNNLASSGVESCVEVSFFEIYNERVRCLLCPAAGDFDNSTLRVREHPKFGPFIEGLTKFLVSTEDELLRLLDDGNKIRTSGATAMNAVSSRSHAVFVVTLTQRRTNGRLVTTKTSKLNLVDLAGSERASKSMATGKRFTEGANINKSLMCLGNVISSLAEEQETGRQRHIPYRDSVLTWILKDNLGGNSKTVMLATISPSSAQYEETMSTLRYAERAKRIVNKAVVNESNNNEVIAALQKEIEQLKCQLQGASESDRDGLAEQLAASEAFQKELQMTMDEKLAESRRLMEEHKSEMQRLEEELEAQRGEIAHLRHDNAEKERRIHGLLQHIEEAKKRLGGRGDTEVEQLLQQVAVLESEQNAASTATRVTATANTPRAANGTVLPLERPGDVRLQLKDDGKATGRGLARTLESVGSEQPPAESAATPRGGQQRRFLDRHGNVTGEKVGGEAPPSSSSTAAADLVVDEDLLLEELLELEERFEAHEPAEEAADAADGVHAGGGGSADSDLLAELDDSLVLDESDLELDLELDLDVAADESAGAKDEERGEAAAAAHPAGDVRLDENGDGGNDVNAAAAGQELLEIVGGVQPSGHEREAFDVSNAPKHCAAAVPQGMTTDSITPKETIAAEKEIAPDAANGIVGNDTSHATKSDAVTATDADTAVDAAAVNAADASTATTTVTGDAAIDAATSTDAASLPATTPLLAPFTALTTLVVPSHALPNNRYLLEPFKVIKINGATLIGGKKDRIWLVDFFKRRFANLDMTGYMSFHYPAGNLFRVEKDPCNSRRLTLHFFEAPHPYELEFTCTGRRHRFYEVAMALRRNSIMWCPSLCLGNEQDVILHVQGTTIDRPNAKSVRVSGDSKFMVARTPYEVVDMWYGCFSMRDRPLPRSAAVLNSFMPQGSHEVYVIGVMDVPRAFIGNDALSKYFLDYLGPSLHYVLANTTVSSKRRKTNNAMIVIVRHSFILRTSHIEAMETTPVFRDDIPKGAFTSVGCALRLNEVGIGILLLNAKPIECTVSRRAAAMRLMMSSFPFGDPFVDIGARFDYFVVSGAFNFGADFRQEDMLLAQMKAGNLMSDLVEATPSSAILTATEPIRIFYAFRPRVCRLDVKQYTTSRALAAPNAFIAADVFCQRAYLGVFSEEVPRVQLVFDNLTLASPNHRIPAVGSPELRISADWIEQSPLLTALFKEGDAYKLSGPAVPVVAPTVSNATFLRLQAVTFSLLGFLPAAATREQSVIASGTLPLKDMLQLGEVVEFSTALYYRACHVGTLSGTLFLAAYERDTAGLAGLESERDVLVVSCYENQILEGKCWVPTVFSQHHAYSFSGEEATTECSREGCVLPDRSKWVWLNLWRHEVFPHDAEGWTYSEGFDQPFHPTRLSKTSLVRRRRWTRVMQASDPMTYHNYVMLQRPQNAAC
ncbi:putative Unc104-like kinesin [Trypanosoma conorhini]|uniref:Putative Unc104-like kinesin n=1 Tax=Trypanosoma conorhini TaxID=83891 RepID=A0A422Q9B9_9TRYP|nr:putative Unc104-like kinesin [Trypanosoma conorhini]RNF26562.1 putative Unc104-like kinesin [Trypanosoma conorhini]